MVLHYNTYVALVLCRCVVVMLCRCITLVVCHCVALMFDRLPATDYNGAGIYIAWRSSFRYNVISSKQRRWRLEPVSAHQQVLPLNGKRRDREQELAIIGITLRFRPFSRTKLSESNSLHHLLLRRTFIMAEQETFERIRVIIVDQLGVEPDDVMYGSQFS